MHAFDCSNPHPARRLDATSSILTVSPCSSNCSNPHPARRLDATSTLRSWVREINGVPILIQPEDWMQQWLRSGGIGDGLRSVPILIQPEDWMQLRRMTTPCHHQCSNPHPARRLDATWLIVWNNTNTTSSNPHPARRLDATAIDPNPLIARSSKAIRAILLFPINPNRSKTQTKLPQTIAVNGIANLPGFWPLLQVRVKIYRIKGRSKSR
jgi:hypothetical protein